MDNAELLDPKVKTRSGIPFTPLHIVAELVLRHAA
jgi:hypothetical protein